MPTGDPPTFLILSVWGVGAASVVGGLSVFNRLVSIERERHPDAWVADGRPRALWIVPRRRGDPSLTQQRFDLLRSNALLLRWLFSTPTWARDDADARRTLWLLRGLQLIGLAAVATWFAIGLASVGRR